MSGRIVPFDNRDQDALAIGELYRKGHFSMLDSVRFLIQAGQRLIEKKALLAHGEWLPWLEANKEILGFATRRTAARLMEAASKWGASYVFDDQTLIAASRTIWGHNTRGTEGTGENEWFTPPEYLGLARAVLGGIDLDPATHEQAQETVKAGQYFTKNDDGLQQEWRGRVWLNPPYAQPLIAHFISKMVIERLASHVTAAIMLTHNYTDTSWFHEAATVADAICFTRGRVKFFEPDGGVAAPTQGQAFFYFGKDVDLFASQFQGVGFVRVPWMPK